ncbi:hypothetical protein HCG46_03370 [Labrenzia sp. PO1]|jgi:hypothetical protein|uniref:hypothetical protein n=1 Tax=Stappiaceae TaxID=2821832 RepID=UPI000A9A30AA|nr:MULTISPECIES: hypothetical protein [Stappiaceae]MEC9418155.1 hypothetical protein [Pseudomonadota bacterium]MBO6856231.1 hypothetical protein [Roseibium sp.]MBO9459842.1 hypothetical protein [Labrenzia sp. R5_0]NKI57282.1 hypothetical protein [Labrenzia sp. PO1]QFT68005.1 hypothetical protein FIU93_14550 [Labrenzia sp. THAF35]
MKTSTFRCFKGLGAILKVTGIIVLPSVCLAADGSAIPWEQQPEILRSEIEGYVKSSLDPATFKVRVAEDVRVVYLGFSPEEIDQNAEQFPDVPGHRISHLPYGRNDYYSIPVDVLDYQLSNTITVLNVDLAKKPGSGEGSGENSTELTEVLAPKGEFFQSLGLSIFELMKVTDGRGTLVEFGPPMTKFGDFEFSFRDKVLETPCTSVFEFAGSDDGGQENTMVVYSGAEPGSADQLQCLKMQSLVFLRPASLPLSTALEER